MKCSFCKNKSIASGGFYHYDGTKTDIQSCSDHMGLLFSKQKTLAMCENLKLSSLRLNSHTNLTPPQA